MTNILSRWFNLPFKKDMPFLHDDNGRKFWIALEEEAFPYRIFVIYRGHSIGLAYLVWNKKDVELTEIKIFDPKFQDHGLGSAFFQFLLNLAKGKGASMFFGHMQPDDDHTIEQLAHFYEKQGAVVDLDRRVFSYRISA